MIQIHIVDENGRGLQEATASRLSGILSRINQCGKQIADGLLWTTRTHFNNIYPGSKHYSPDKVQETKIENKTNPSGEIEIDVPGITRAYRDLTIRPKFRKWLTIPMHQSAFGKKIEDFNNLLVQTNKDGKRFLVQKQGGHLIYLFRLVKQVFQKQDRGLMPSDETFAKNIVSRITAYLSMAK